MGIKEIKKGPEQLCTSSASVALLGFVLIKSKFANEICFYVSSVVVKFARSWKTKKFLHKIL